MSDKKLLAVEMVLNNLDFMRVPFEYIGIFQLNGLTTNDSTKSEYWAKQFVISIDRNYKDCTCEFSVDAMDCLRDCYISFIERIYENENVRDKVYIDWFIQYQNHNVYQRSKSNKHGDLFLEISEQAELDSIFPDEIINADNYTVLGKRVNQ